MATILESKAHWTVTPEAAKILEADGTIFECDPQKHEDLLSFERPVYHVTFHGKMRVGADMVNMHQIITDAHRQADGGEPKQFTVTGMVAAAPAEYGQHAIIVLLNGQPLPRKFKAAESVRITALGP